MNNHNLTDTPEWSEHVHRRQDVALQDTQLVKEQEQAKFVLEDRDERLP